ncbi:MAG: hypothetical protein PHC64_05615 [Candidatus Gastranaerophilales bacterium]|nr:hypothetical protein [Candidatus Gastranaerophilales bacterium]
MRDYDEYLINSLKDKEEAMAYLNASLEAYLEDKNTQALMSAFENLSRAKYPMKELAKRLGIKSQNLYRIFDNKINPNFTIIFSLIDELGFRLEVKQS